MPGVWKIRPLGTLDGVVGGQVHKSRLFIETDVARDIGIILVRRGGHYPDGFGLDLRFLDGLGGPGTGIHVVGGFVVGQKILLFDHAYLFNLF